MLKVQSSSLVCDVGPADRTGKSVVTYCPGGKRFFGACCCRLDLKPREIGGSSMCVVPFLGERLAYCYKSRAWRSIHRTMLSDSPAVNAIRRYSVREWVPADFRFHERRSAGLPVRL